MPLVRAGSGQCLENKLRGEWEARVLVNGKCGVEGRLCHTARRHLLVVGCVGGAALNTWVHEAQALHSLFLLIESRVEIFEEISFSFQW